VVDNAGEEEREERGSEDAGEGERDSESRCSLSSSSSEDESSIRSEDLYVFEGDILRNADEELRSNAWFEVFLRKNFAMEISVLKLAGSARAAKHD
jgi:hypothetical protein